LSHSREDFILAWPDSKPAEPNEHVSKGSAGYTRVNLLYPYGLSQEKFYDKRERSVENGNVELHPLRISYGFAVRRDQLERFVKKITNQYSCSVIHGGNPYFVADLCDYRDGSSFGVAILGNAVTLTPMARATSFAVWRLVGEVQEILGDGDIAEVQTR